MAAPLSMTVGGRPTLASDGQTFDVVNPPPAVERGRALLRLATVIRDHAEAPSRLESTNIGKPISSARWEIGAAAGVFEFCERHHRARRRHRSCAGRPPGCGQDRLHG